MSPMPFEINRPGNPLDTLEQIAFARDWSFDRPGESELDFALAGRWGDYAVSLIWRDDLEILHMAAEVDIKIFDGKRAALIELLALINEQMYIGHFGLWSEEGVILFRHGLILQGASATPGQCEELVRIAVAACDRFYPAFQYLIWAGQRPQDALAAAVFETEGYA